MYVFVLSPTQVGEFQAPITGRIKHSGSWWFTLAQEQVIRTQHSLINSSLNPHPNGPNLPLYEDAAYHHQLCSS